MKNSAIIEKYYLLTIRAQSRVRTATTVRETGDFINRRECIWLSKIYHAQKYPEERALLDTQQNGVTFTNCLYSYISVYYYKKALQTTG